MWLTRIVNRVLHFGKKHIPEDERRAAEARFEQSKRVQHDIANRQQRLLLLFTEMEAKGDAGFFNEHRPADPH